MRQVKFSDGVIINIDGPPYTFQLYDGWYVAGQGMLIPAQDEDEATALIYSISTKENEEAR